LFRDNYTHLTSTGLSIYGLSTDSPKANTTFKTKQNLTYSLLCNPSATLIGAIGFKKAPKGTTRGVFAVDKKGKVLLREAGGPDATVDAVQKLVAQDPAKGDAKEEASDDAEAK
jgi:peroxiredoxin Q/BCP